MEKIKTDKKKENVKKYEKPTLETYDGLRTVSAKWRPPGWKGR